MKSSRSSKYKPLTRNKRLVHKIIKTKRTMHKDVKLPNINPSVREIWKFQRDGNILFKDEVIGNFNDEDRDTLDLIYIIPSLVQDSDFTYEKVLEFFRFFPSLFALCKSKGIKIINIPNVPSLQEYKKIKEGED